MINTVLAGNGQITAALAARRKVAAAAPAWWMAAGATPVAVYQGIGAASQAASYVNLVNPGTYDLTPNNSPGWAYGTGWVLDGLGQYLACTGLAMGNGWSVAVRFANFDITTVAVVFGHRVSVNNGVLMLPNAAGSAPRQRNYRYGDSLFINGDTPNGIMAIANQTAYYNGVAETGTLLGTDTSSHAPFIGALNTAGTPGVYFIGTVQAVAIYDTDIGAQMAALTTEMAALGPAIPATDATPGVYIVFDDNLEGVYDLAYPYMAASDIAGTIYTITDFIGDAGYMTSAQLLECDGAGWDIGNHTASHVDLSTLTLAQQRAEILAARNALDALGLTRASGDMSYPLGGNNSNTLAAMQRMGMRSGRTITNGAITLPAGALGRYTLPTYRYYTGDSLATLQTNINNALAANNDVMVYTHNVVTSGGTAFDITYAEFTALIDWLVAQSIHTKTISQLPLA